MRRRLDAYTLQCTASSEDVEARLSSMLQRADEEVAGILDREKQRAGVGTEAGAGAGAEAGGSDTVDPQTDESRKMELA